LKPQEVQVKAAIPVQVQEKDGDEPSDSEAVIINDKTRANKNYNIVQ
jgi:hypothetical protein